MRRILLIGCSLVALASIFAPRAEARYPSFPNPHHTIADRWSARFSMVTPWHGGYYHTATGRPVALVVPPTANMKTRWSWGVAQSEIRPIHPRFARPYPGEVYGGEGYFLPTPHWPSHTDQFGVYYVRGPWE